MKVILQGFEPLPQPFAGTHVAAEIQPVSKPVRKPRLRLNPVVSDVRLFHAL